MPRHLHGHLRQGRPSSPALCVICLFHNFHLVLYLVRSNIFMKCFRTHIRVASSLRGFSVALQTGASPFFSHHKTGQLSTATMSQRYKLVFFTPLASLLGIKRAIFEAGAGRYPPSESNANPEAVYTETMWTSAPGVGQFRPGDNANPTIGKVGELEEVEEVRCEVLCVGKDIVRAAVEALRKSHEYEVPAYEVYRIEDF